MRLVYALIALFLWVMLMLPVQSVSPDMRCLSLAIVIAGALAGGGGQ